MTSDASATDRFAGLPPSIEMNSGTHIRRNLRRREILEKSLQVRKVEVVRPLSYSKLVTAVVVLSNRNVVNGTEAVNSDQRRTISGTGETGDIDRSLNCRSCLSYWFETIQLNGWHDEVYMISDVLGQAILVASDTVTTRLLVLEVVVFGVQKSLKFSNSS
jgi:hypothetical protein